MKKTVLAVLATLMLTLNFAAASETLLGDLKLVYRDDSDSLKMPACDANSYNNVSAIRLIVAENGAEIEDLMLTFHDGSKQRVSLTNSTIEEGQESDWIEIAGGPKCIKKIAISGDVADCGCGSDLITGLTKKTIITVVGRQ